MKKLFDALQCPEDWRVGFVGFYLREEVDLWWATVMNRQYELGFEWNEFKELVKNRFYLVSPQKDKRIDSSAYDKGR